MYLFNPDQEGFPGRLRNIIILEDRRLRVNYSNYLNKILKLFFFLRRLKCDLLNSKVCISKVKDNMKKIKSNFLNFPPMHGTTKCDRNFVHQITARKDNYNKQVHCKIRQN